MERMPALKEGFRFGVFEVDLEGGELRKSGLKVPIQDQPFQVLTLLLARPGKVVTREEVREKLWPRDTFVEFDRSLNTAVAKLREALGDSADNPRFVETIPRRGYRFLTPVQRLGETVQVELAPDVDGSTTTSWYSGRSAWISVLAGALALAVGFIVWQRLEAPQVAPDLPLRKWVLAPTNSLNIGSPVISPSGRSIAYLTGSPRGSGPIGASNRTTLGMAARSERASRAGQPTCWPGSGSLCPFFWSPGDDFIAFTSGRELRKVAVQGGNVTLLCQIPEGFFIGGAWAPDGNSIVFTTTPPNRLYELSAQGGDPRAVDRVLGASRRIRIRPTSCQPRLGRVFCFSQPKGRSCFITWVLGSGESWARGYGRSTLPVATLSSKRDVRRMRFGLCPFPWNGWSRPVRRFQSRKTPKRPVLRVTGHWFTSNPLSQSGSS